MTFLCPSSPSKQRHNKLWRQQTESRLQQPVGDLAGSGDFLPETLDDAREARLSCLDDAAQPGFPGGGGPSLSCCFRRLSDPLLCSPSDETGGLVQLDDLEKDALLEEAAQPSAAPKPARPPQEGPGPCEKEVKKKPEFGSPKAHRGPLPAVEEMEREEAPGAGRWGRSPAQLDKSLLNRENLNNNNSKRSCPDDFEVGVGQCVGQQTRHITSVLPPSRAPPSPLRCFVPPARQFLPPGTPGFVSEPAVPVPAVRPPSLQGPPARPRPPGVSWSLAVSRSHVLVPFQHDALFGILNKVKPSYKSCADCMYPAASRAPEAFGERRETPGAPAICTQPTFLPHLTSSPVAHTASRSRALEKLASGPPETPPLLPPAGPRRPDPGGSGPRAAPEPPASLLEPSKETPKVLPKALLLKNSHCDKSPPGMEVVKEESPPKKDVKPAKDLRLLFSKDAEKPSAHSYLMQHQESIIQLQKAGLVRKHTKELERLKGAPADPAAPLRDGPAGRLEASIPEESPDLAPDLPPPGASDEKPEATPIPPEGASLKSPSPFLCRLDHTSHFSKDFLKTICYTPTSSSMSSNLTRSSSSDSIHSVRGKPGLVKQRTQEIETRLRLAGLTVSSPLKRSHSLAKLGSLDFSTEDLTSEADLSTIADSQDAKSSEASFLHEPQAAPQNPAAPSQPSGKPAPENLKSSSWLSKS